MTRNIYDGRKAKSPAEATGEPLDPRLIREARRGTVSGSASIDLS
jgi:hypothetical protein